LYRSAGESGVGAVFSTLPFHPSRPIDATAMPPQIPGRTVIAHALVSLSARVLPMLIWGTPLFRRHLLPVLTHLLAHLLALFRCQPGKMILLAMHGRQRPPRGQTMGITPKYRNLALGWPRTEIEGHGEGLTSEGRASQNQRQQTNQSGTGRHGASLYRTWVSFCPVVVSAQCPARARM